MDLPETSKRSKAASGKATKVAKVAKVAKASTSESEEEEEAETKGAVEVKDAETLWKVNIEAVYRRKNPCT